MGDGTSLFLGLVFGSIGMAYLVYGIKRRRAVVMLCGFAVSGLPYIVNNTAAMVALGIAILAVPAFVKS